MTTKTKHVLEEALSLTATDRISLVDTLISSLDLPDPNIDTLWQREIDSRLKAYKKGHIKSVSLAHAIAKYKK
jgi:putative addiction module component (TIGR02574 family)